MEKGIEEITIMVRELEYLKKASLGQNNFGRGLLRDEEKGCVQEEKHIVKDGNWGDMTSYKYI